MLVWKNFFLFYSIITNIGQTFWFQIIEGEHGAFSTEILNDFIEVKNGKLWEIKINKQTGAIESWKVTYDFRFKLYCPQQNCKCGSLTLGQR